MKKTIALILSLVLVLSLSAVASAELLGLGVVTNIGSVKEAAVKDGEKYDGQGQVNSVICTVVLDDNKVIKAVQFDTVQTKLTFNGEGKLTNDLEAAILTKIEKGEAYGMKGASAIGKEWFEQIAEFEKYIIGKTIEEVLAIPTYERDANHKRVPDVADLKTTVTIDIGGYVDALVKAVANAK